MVGETLPLEQQTYRVKVVGKNLPSCCSSTEKIGIFLKYSGTNTYRLSDRRHMSDFIPFVLKQEQDMIKKETPDEHVSVTFDGTTCLGEALAVVIRYVSEQTSD